MLHVVTLACGTCWDRSCAMSMPLRLVTKRVLVFSRPGRTSLAERGSPWATTENNQLTSTMELVFTAKHPRSSFWFDYIKLCPETFRKSGGEGFRNRNQRLAGFGIGCLSSSCPSRHMSCGLSKSEPAQKCLVLTQMKILNPRKNAQCIPNTGW